jgi:hypothetical protein
MLPAGSFFNTDSAARTSQLDLTLVEPDNNPRSLSINHGLMAPEVSV